MEILTLAPGEKISRPGLYNIPLEVHHGQPCDGPSVTSSVLRKMELETPADVWAFSPLNPDRWEKPDSDALRMGRAMAAFVEGGMEAVGREFLVLPADKPRKPTEAQCKAYDEGRASDAAILSVEFWSGIEADGRTPLTDAEVTLIENMGRVLAADLAAAAVMGGLPEITMAYQDEITGLWILSRPDCINFDGTAVDYKTASTKGGVFNHRLIDRNIERYAYHMQMALAAEAMERTLGAWPSSVGLVFQLTEPPHHVVLREIGEQELRAGQIQNRKALDRFAHCLETGDWPGPGSDIGAWKPSDRFWERITELTQGEAA